MKFLYKIYSNFDGFRPEVIPQRLDVRGRLPLGWARYIESVEDGSEVWIYFHGRHAFANGVYIKGIADEIDIDDRRVYLRLVEYSTSDPLSDSETTQRVAAAVAVRFRQVFLLPEELETPTCLMATTAESCATRQCASCTTWNELPRIEQASLVRPHRLPTAGAFVPAYWVIPRRSFIHMGGRHPRQGIRRTSELFKRFKTGQKELTYPLALGIHRRLDEEVSGSFDAIVPIPLSPEKASAGEIHRTRLLARELSALRQVPVREVLSLDVAISKRRLRTMQGLGYRQFEARYYQALQVDSTAGTLGRILLVDDVCTEGSTMRSAARRLAEASPHAEIVLAAAGQMVVRPAVLDETALLQTAA